MDERTGNKVDASIGSVDHHHLRGLEASDIYVEDWLEWDGPVTHPTDWTLTELEPVFHDARRRSLWRRFSGWLRRLRG